MQTFLRSIRGVMRRGLPALRKKIILAILTIVLFASVSLILAQNMAGNDTIDLNYGEVRWYRSNSSGIAIELIPSRLAALRSEYALSVERLNPSSLPRILPQIIRNYYQESYRLELRLLYENGTEIRRQYILRDGRGLARVAAAGSPSFFMENAPAAITPNTLDEEEGEEEEPVKSGIIEIRNSDGLVTREFQFDEDQAEWDFRYFYSGNTLLRMETWYKEPPLPPVTEEEPVETASDIDSLEETSDEAYLEESAEEESGRIPLLLALPRPAATQAEAPQPAAPQAAAPQPVERIEPVLALALTDYYRYTRSGSLRAIDRTIHEGAGTRTRVGFPRLGPGAGTNDVAVAEGGAYTASFFMGVRVSEGATINYTLDNRGRILGEVWRDEDGKLLGQLTNTWSADRLQSVLWDSGGIKRRIEYEYDRSGNPLVERNYRDGVLERSVTTEGNTEVEEIYMNGRLILRAYYENGLKIKEERGTSGGGSAAGNSRGNSR